MNKLFTLLLLGSLPIALTAKKQNISYKSTICDNRINLNLKLEIATFEAEKTATCYLNMGNDKNVRYEKVIVQKCSFAPFTEVKSDIGTFIFTNNVGENNTLWGVFKYPHSKKSIPFTYVKTIKN